MPDLLPALEVETAPNPEFAVIWLHGLGADGSDFVPVVPELGLPERPGVRFVFPHAPMIPVTCNNGYVMRAWYDIHSLAPRERKVDAAGVLASCAAVAALIARENQRGIPTRHIFLAGFSQGGAIAYTAGLGHPEPLAGIIALSTYLPTPDLLGPETRQANRATPVFAAHGSEDGVVAPALGTWARDLLQSWGQPLDWHEYPIEHGVCLEEIRDIGAWLGARMAALAT